MTVSTGSPDLVIMDQQGQIFPTLHSPETECDPGDLASSCLFQEACPDSVPWLSMSLICAGVVALTRHSKGNSYLPSFLDYQVLESWDCLIHPRTYRSVRYRIAAQYIFVELNK